MNNTDFHDGKITMSVLYIGPKASWIVGCIHIAPSGANIWLAQCATDVLSYICIIIQEAGSVIAYPEHHIWRSVDLLWEIESLVLA